MNCIGYDAIGIALQIGDICTFRLENEKFPREGIIVYDEDVFAYCFEMKDDNFPIVIMKKAKLGTIQKIVNVWSTKIDDAYKWYRELFKERIDM